MDSRSLRRKRHTWFGRRSCFQYPSVSIATNLVTCANTHLHGQSAWVRKELNLKGGKCQPKMLHRRNSILENFGNLVHGIMCKCVHLKTATRHKDNQSRTNLAASIVSCCPCFWPPLDSRGPSASCCTSSRQACGQQVQSIGQDPCSV